MSRTTIRKLRADFKRGQRTELSTGTRSRWVSRSGRVCVDGYPRPKGRKVYYVQQGTLGPRGNFVWDIHSRHRSQHVAFQTAQRLDMRLAKAK